MLHAVSQFANTFYGMLRTVAGVCKAIAGMFHAVSSIAEAIFGMLRTVCLI